MANQRRNDYQVSDVESSLRESDSRGDSESERQGSVENEVIALHTLNQGENDPSNMSMVSLKKKK
jgi:hypothetical protein